MFTKYSIMWFITLFVDIVSFYFLTICNEKTIFVITCLYYINKVIIKVEFEKINVAMILNYI